MSLRNSIDQTDAARPSPDNGIHALASLCKRPFQAGMVNVGLCHVMMSTYVLSPVALVFATVYADVDRQVLREHHHYIKTSGAILLIGTSISGLLWLAGAALSTVLILIGLAAMSLTAALVFLRSLNGLALCLRKQPPKNYRSYLV
ncbi:MAG: hypothetical protein JJ979_19090 [Roseibium sp.]|nr:hypothetical protein [Roseibium sp.]